MTISHESTSGLVDVDRISLTYPGAAQSALADVSFSASGGEVVTLLGPSGCGKTSALRVIAGLESPTTGTVRLDAVDITDWSPERRQMGFVFQNYALFPHLDVADNVGFGLKVRGVRRNDIDAAVNEALELVKLSQLRNRRIDQLSGGQQQRIALARALAIRPKVLLLDEPLSNLDAALREQTRDALRELLQNLDVTTFFVTHDQADAFAFSNRIVLMRAGRVVEIGPPERLYNEPETEFAAQFLGAANVFDVNVDQAGESVLLHLDGAAVRLSADSWSDSVRPGADGRAVIRPERCSLEAEDGPNRLKSSVTDVTYLGASYRITLSINGLADPVRLQSERRPQSGTGWVHLPREAIRIVGKGE